MDSQLLEILDPLLDTGTPPAPDTDLFDAGLDSMGIMQLLLGIEERYGVALDPADLSRENFQTPARISALIRAKQSPTSD